MFSRNKKLNLLDIYLILVLKLSPEYICKLKCHFKFPKTKIFIQNQIEYFEIVKVLKFFIFLGKSDKNQHKRIQTYNFIKTESSNRNMFCQNKEVFRYLQH